MKGNVYNIAKKPTTHNKPIPISHFQGAKDYKKRIGKERLKQGKYTIQSSRHEHFSKGSIGLYW